MKKYKKTLTAIIILVVAFLMLMGFYGIFRRNENGEWVNLIPNFKLGMEFGQTRVITVGVNQESTRTVYDAEGNVVQEEEGVEYTEENGYTIEETPINDSALKNLNNYNIEKKIIDTRLKKSKVSQYFIDMNEITGKIKIEIPEDEKADEIQSMLQSSGNFMLLDGSTFETVFSDEYLDKAEVMYSQGDIETGVFLQLKFNEEGTKKLQELSKIYTETATETTDTTNENEGNELEETTTDENEAANNEQTETKPPEAAISEDEAINNETVATEENETTNNEEGTESNETTESKEVWVIVNGAFIGTAHISDLMYNDTVMLTYGLSSNTEEIQTAVDNAEEAALLLNTGNAPLVYEFSNETVQSNIDNRTIAIYVIGVGLVFVIAYIYFIVKFKVKGFISIYFQIGFLAVLLLIIRLTDVTLTMEGMAGIVISLVLEYIFTYMVLENMTKQKENMYKNANLEFFLSTLPIYVIAVIFTFALRANINSFGKTLFWGIIMIYIYNFIFPKFIYENLNGRSE